MCHSLSGSHGNLLKDRNKTALSITVNTFNDMGLRKEMVIMMKQIRERMKDACVYIISLVSIAVFFGEIFHWMLYI